MEPLTGDRSLHVQLIGGKFQTFDRGMTPKSPHVLERHFIWLVGSKIFYVHLETWGRFPILTNIFQRGWVNHQPVMLERGFLFWKHYEAFAFWTTRHGEVVWMYHKAIHRFRVVV